MRLVSTNVGRREPIDTKIGVTGIYKRPVDGTVEVTRLGIDGDAICDTASHGGIEQAVYLYSTGDYAWWSAELGQDVLPGTFGDNLTIDGFLSADVCVGDRFSIGDVELEATSPRIPCLTLARRMDDKQFVKRFMEAERPGVYCRVLREGPLEAGLDVGHTPFSGPRVTMLETFRRIRDNDYDDEAIELFFAVPLNARIRNELDARRTS